MTILYVDRPLALPPYRASEPIIDALEGAAIETRQYMWRRHAQCILAYRPRVPWQTTSGTPTIDNDNTADFAEPLNIYPMSPEFRPDSSGDYEYTFTVRGGLVTATIIGYDATYTPVAVATVTLGAGPTVQSDTATVPASTGPVIWLMNAERNGGSGTGEITEVTLHSRFMSDAPR
jgi:hypothetical protein